MAPPSWQRFGRKFAAPFHRNASSSNGHDSNVTQSGSTDASMAQRTNGQPSGGTGAPPASVPEQSSGTTVPTETQALIAEAEDANTALVSTPARGFNRRNLGQSRRPIQNPRIAHHLQRFRAERSRRAGEPRRRFERMVDRVSERNNRQTPAFRLLMSTHSNRNQETPFRRGHRRGPQFQDTPPIVSVQAREPSEEQRLAAPGPSAHEVDDMSTISGDMPATVSETPGNSLRQSLDRVSDTADPFKGRKFTQRVPPTTGSVVRRKPVDLQACTVPDERRCGFKPPQVSSGQFKHPLLVFVGGDPDTSRPWVPWGNPMRWACCTCRRNNPPRFSITVREQKVCSRLACQHLRCNACTMISE